MTPFDLWLCTVFQLQITLSGIFSEVVGVIRQNLGCFFNSIHLDLFAPVPPAATALLQPQSNRTGEQEGLLFALFSH